MGGTSRSRTVNDYGTTRSLRQALKPVDEEGSCGGTDVDVDDHDDDRGSSSSSHHNTPENLDENWDWVLTNYDVGTTLPQSLSQELHRLQVLKSYLILDDEREETFERLTNMASRIFSVPIALVSLVDLGRQWFMSNHGLGDVRETPRDVAFCAHAIQGINDVFVVRDTLEDWRFCDSPLVKGAPFIRFYAGAPLLSPEGYKLGTFCIIDSKPKPNGLSVDEEANLKDFAAMAMKSMVDRRNLKSQVNTEHIVACTAHDLLTPLMGIQLSLSILEEDNTLNEIHRESVQNAARSSDWLHRICETTMETLRVDPTTTDGNNNNNNNNNTADDACDNNAAAAAAAARRRNSHKKNGGSGAATVSSNPFIDLKDFISSLNLTMASIPKKVPLVLTVDQNVPSRIVSDDLKLFRSSLNLLSNAFANTESGSVHFRLRVAPSSKEKDQNVLVFECTDTGIDLQINKEEEECLFKPCSKTLTGVVKDLGLYSVAYQIDALGGSYGYRSRADDTEEKEGQSGSIFWFQVPIVLPEDVSIAGSVSVGGGGGGEADMVVRFPAATHNQQKQQQHGVKKDCNSVKEQVARSGGIIAVAAAAVESSTKSTGGSCCGLDELAKFESVEAYKDYHRHRRNNRSKPSSEHSLLDQTASTKGSSTDQSREGGGGVVVGTKQRTSVAALWNSVQTTKRSTTPGQNVADTTKCEPTIESVPKTILISKDDHVNNGISPADLVPNVTRQKKALVIEDTLVVRKTLTRALQKKGYEVSQAVDGVEGLAALKSTVFDITLCDFLMPNMDGLDCCSSYRQWEMINRPYFKQYIVGISAHVSQKDVEKGLEIGMNDFRPKPITMKTLQELDESSAIELVRKRLDEMEVGGEMSEEANPTAEPTTIAAAEKGVATQQQKSCLMATARSDAASAVAAEQMKSEGWDVTIVQNGTGALDSLKSRNWGVVILDDKLPCLSGNQCVEQFRLWEGQNRVNRQDNIIVVCTDVLLSNPNTCMLPPAGFDGAIDRQVSWSHLRSLIRKEDKASQSSVIRAGLSIVTR